MKNEIIPFRGFSPDALSFLKSLSENNNRPWFQAHQEEYRRLLHQPALGLANELGPMCAELDPLLITIPNRVVSRVYRDTRFSHDKTPYRVHVFMSFRREVERWSETPAFFVQIEAERYMFGMGIYTTTAATMRRYRALIDEAPDRFLSVIEPIERTRSMSLETKKYKRLIPNNFTGKTARILEPWYQSKSVEVIGYRPPDKTLYSAALVEYIMGRFVLLKPYYDFVWRAVKES